jgi:hypothetical protein
MSQGTFPSAGKQLCVMNRAFNIALDELAERLTQANTTLKTPKISAGRLP